MANSERAAKRVVIDIHKSSNFWEESFTQPNIIIDIALDALKKKILIPSETLNESDIRLIIKKITRTDTRIVFDIFHDTFDPAKAHLYGQDPPVVVIFSIDKRERRKTFVANTLQERKVNFEIRFLYNRSGTGSEPPFSEDSRTGIAWSIPNKSFRDYAEYRAQQDDEIASVKAKWQPRAPR